jgi:hypothetical protein
VEFNDQLHEPNGRYIIYIQRVSLTSLFLTRYINVLEPTDYVMHHQFNIQQSYALPTLYLCVLYLSENKQRLVPLTALTDWVFVTEMKSVYSAVRIGSLNKAVCASFLKG